MLVFLTENVHQAGRVLNITPKSVKGPPVGNRPALHPAPQSGRGFDACSSLLGNQLGPWLSSSHGKKVRQGDGGKFRACILFEAIFWVSEVCILAVSPPRESC